MSRHLQPRARRVKVLATLGPASASEEMISKLHAAGADAFRVNMSHGSHESHGAVVDLVREYNGLGRRVLATMLDTKVCLFVWALCVRGGGTRVGARALAAARVGAAVSLFVVARRRAPS